MSPPVAEPYRLSKRRVIVPGAPVRVIGEAGTYRYCGVSLSTSGAVSIHVVGTHGYRAFRPERIRATK